MKILFEKGEVLGLGRKFVEVTGRTITYVGDERPDGCFDRVIDTKNKLIMPGLFNTHCHCAMTLFRGYGEDMPLDSWLNTRIFPAEDKLTDRAVYVASLYAIAEMIRNGTVSFTDMYYFCEETAKAVGESGIKANISRSIVSFDEDIDVTSDYRFREGRELFESFHNAFDGRLKVDMALHAEYTNVGKMVRAVADYAASHNASVQIHLSETKSEHDACVAKYGYTPTEFFRRNGLFEANVTAAHCVWLTEEDMDILKESGAYAVHNPASNLKLGSGFMPLARMLEKGVNVSLGTDGPASNNTLDMIKDMYLASLAQKGHDLDPAKVKAQDIVKLATVNGALSQQRAESGCIEVGKRADIIMLDLDTLNNIPSYDPYYTVVYSASGRDCVFNMVDGQILYENGEFKTLDVEKIKSEMKDVVAHYFD